jgi:hypothetical protein
MISVGISSRGITPAMLNTKLTIPAIKTMPTIALKNGNVMVVL